MARTRLPSLRLRTLQARWPNLLVFSRSLVADHHVGNLRDFGHQRTAYSRQPEAPKRIRAGHSLFTRQNQFVAENGAPPRRARIDVERLWHAPAPQLPLAGIRGEGHARRSWPHVHRNL